MGLVLGLRVCLVKGLLGSGLVLGLTERLAGLGLGDNLKKSYYQTGKAATS